MQLIIAFLLSRFRPEITSILGGFDKLQAQLDSYVSRTNAKLEKIQTAIDNAVSARDATNADLDRAYRVLHKVSELVK